MSSVFRAARTRRRRATALLSSGVLLMGVAVVGLVPGGALASSHREAPLVVGDPLADNTDTYAFVSPDDPDSVTLIANWIPFEEPNGGPNFYPWGTGDQGYSYDIKIDSNGDAKPDLVYRWTFSTQDTRGSDTFLYANGPVTSLTDDNLLFRQTYSITVSTDGGNTFPTTLLADAPVAPSNVGPASMPNYDEELFAPAVTGVGGGGQSYAGQADDPFFLDLRVFDLLYGGDLSETGQDTLGGYNVNTVALKLPKAALALNNDDETNPVIGVWSTTSRQNVDLADQTLSGDDVQVSRLGNPLINEVIVPAGLKDAFNAIGPDQDAAAADGKVLDRVLRPEVPVLIESIYGATAPTGDPGADQTTNRSDLAEIFLTGVTTKLDDTGFYADTLKAGGDAAPIGLDLNSQLLNGDSNDPAGFQPSEMLRLNMSITAPSVLGPDGQPQPLDGPDTLGVVGGDIQGFPNGRRLADDVVDIELVTLGGFFLGDEQGAQAATLAEAGGDGVDANDREFTEAFPYLASPNNQGVNTQGGGIRTPIGGMETGAGPVPTSGSSALPVVSGVAALVLIGAGAASLRSGRRRRSAAE